MARYILTRLQIDPRHGGWELSGSVSALHTSFDRGYRRDVDAAQEWAEKLIGHGRLEWRYVRDRGVDRWEARV